MRASKINSEKLRRRRLIADYFLRKAIPKDFLVTRRSPGERVDEIVMRSMAFLEQHGCDPAALHAILDMAKCLGNQKEYSLPKTINIRPLMKMMERTAAGIRSLEPSGFLGFLDHQKTAGEEKRVRPQDDVSHPLPFLAISSGLETGASTLRSWLELASQNIPPKHIGIDRLTRVCLAIYVKARTGKPNFRHVITLLDFAGTGVDLNGIKADPAQLSRELKDIENYYPRCWSELNRRFSLLHNNPFISMPRLRSIIFASSQASRTSCSAEISHGASAPTIEDMTKRHAKGTPFPSASLKNEYTPFWSDANYLIL